MQLTASKSYITEENVFILTIPENFDSIALNSDFAFTKYLGRILLSPEEGHRERLLGQKVESEAVKFNDIYSLLLKIAFV